MSRTLLGLVTASALICAAAPAAMSQGTQSLAEADIAALRYFISIGDTESMQAEIRRLEAQFPGVDVPATVEEITGRTIAVDEGPIWDKVNADDHAAAHALIAEAQAAEPTYAPSEELTRILRDRETQAALETALTARNLPAAVAALQSNPVLTTCERINNPWRVADLFIENAMPDQAIAIHHSILQTCSAPDHVRTTLQKAAHVGDEAQMSALFALADARDIALAAELAPLKEELMAWVVSRNAPPAETVKTARPARPPVAPRPTGDPLLARAAAAADRSDWAECLALTANRNSIDMTHQRAWCALNAGRPAEALAGFQAAAQKPSLRASAEYGMVLAYARLGKPQQAQAVAETAQLTPTQRAETRKQLLTDRAMQAYKSRKWREAVSHIDQLRAQTGSLDRGMLMMRGWALHNLGQKGAAIEQFRAVHAKSPGNDSRKALVEAYR